MANAPVTTIENDSVVENNPLVENDSVARPGYDYWWFGVHSSQASMSVISSA